MTYEPGCNCRCCCCCHFSFINIIWTATLFSPHYYQKFHKPTESSVHIHFFSLLDFISFFCYRHITHVHCCRCCSCLFSVFTFVYICFASPCVCVCECCYLLFHFPLFQFFSCFLQWKQRVVFNCCNYVL